MKTTSDPSCLHPEACQKIMQDASLCLECIRARDHQAAWSGDLTDRQRAIWHHLRNNPKLNTLDEIAAAIETTPQTVIKSLDRMTAKGFVTRKLGKHRTIKAIDPNAVVTTVDKVRQRVGSRSLWFVPSLKKIEVGDPRPDLSGTDLTKAVQKISAL